MKSETNGRMLAQEIEDKLYSFGLSRSTTHDFPPGQRVPWRISPQPFSLTGEQSRAIAMLGSLLYRFYRAADRLYQLSLEDKHFGFVAEYLDMGKPEELVALGRQDRFKGQLPLILRPDLLWTEQGFIASEFDSIPGGVGLLSGMEEAYACQGYADVTTLNSFVEALLEIHKRGAIAIVVSEESEGYRPEMEFVAARLVERGLKAYCLRPEEVVVGNQGVFYGPELLGTIYRFFELFDLENVPGGMDILDAAARGLVRVTPPPKAYLEEKLWFALLRHHRLVPYWQKAMGKANYEHLLQFIPHTHILDNRELPPHAVIYGLTARGQALNSYLELRDLPRGERRYVVKPSGFSPLSWGSRGISLGRELNASEWSHLVEQSLDRFPTNPHLLQEFHYSLLQRTSFYDFSTDEIREFEGKVRYCPYYFTAAKNKVLAGGVLATICPAEKPLIHGMTDAVMVPAF